MNTTLESTSTLTAADYYINYYGKVIDIQNTTKVLALFIDGGGFTGDMGQYYGSSKYELYIPNKKDFGKTLVCIGKAESHFNGYEISCTFTLNDQRHDVSGLVVSNLFSEIFKRNS